MNLNQFATIVRCLVLMIALTFSVEDLQAKGPSNESRDIRRGQLLGDGSARSRCEYMQALRRRTHHLVGRYEELREKTLQLIDEAPFERRSIREQLRIQLREVNGQLAMVEDEYRDLSVRIVRRGCPMRDFEQITEDSVRELFDAASREGIFVDDHLLRVEDYDNFNFLLENL